MRRRGLGPTKEFTTVAAQLDRRAMPTNLPQRKSAARDQADESDPVLLLGTVTALALILCLSIVELTRLDHAASPQGEMADLSAQLGENLAGAGLYAPRRGARPAFVAGVNIKPD
jgi:hypothetical protein